MGTDELRAKASNYCRKHNLKPKFDGRLGQGQDGIVWETSAASAIKVFDRERTYKTELECYQILKREGIINLLGFNVPELIRFDSGLYVIEMTIVQAPYILDFGKAYCHTPPRRHTWEAMQEYYEQLEDDFGETLEHVELALASLKRYGIFYIDVRPGNINCKDLPPLQS